jgi:iron complex transport system substrate-binding protein
MEPAAIANGQFTGSDLLRPHRQCPQCGVSGSNWVHAPRPRHLWRRSAYKLVGVSSQLHSIVELTNRIRLRGLAYSAAAALFTFAPNVCAAGEAHKPTRIVSVNLCTDELVLRLADHKNIASVTWLAATSSGSNVADLATQIPTNHGLAEEVIPLDPDLVVAGIYTARAAVALLKRTGIPVLDLDVPRSLSEIRSQYRQVGQALGEEERAERVIAEMDSRLAAIPVSRTSPRPRAMVFNPNGYTIGKGTLTDEIITRAGMENLSATLGIDKYSQISLETVVTNAVDVLIVSAYRDGPPAMATEILRHPVLAKISDRTRIAVVPSRLWACAGPGNIDAIALLHNVANAVGRRDRLE